MMQIVHFRRFAVYLFVAALLPSPAYAYLDPGTGGMILHLILGAIAGGLVAVKVYWGKFKSVLSRSEPADGNNGSDK